VSFSFSKSFISLSFSLSLISSSVILNTFFFASWPLSSACRVVKSYKSERRVALLSVGRISTPSSTATPLCLFSSLRPAIRPCEYLGVLKAKGGEMCRRLAVLAPRVQIDFICLYSCVGCVVVTYVVSATFKPRVSRFI
jgi:hypothetical protein